MLSGDVCKMLLEINSKLKLKFTPIEDATLGFWLMSMDLRHVDHPKCAHGGPPADNCTHACQCTPRQGQILVHGLACSCRCVLL